MIHQSPKVVHLHPQDTNPLCCDGRCLSGATCPQQNCCPIRAAAAEAAAKRYARDQEIDEQAAARAGNVFLWRCIAWAWISVGTIRIVAWGLYS